MLTSRQRVELTLAHCEADRVPLDLGGCGQTGMHASTVYALRQALHLDPPGTPVRVVEPFQMLGEIAPDLRDAVGSDVVSLTGTTTLFGYRNEHWKEWTLFDGTPLLVPGNFNTEPNESGDILMYVNGDRSFPPSGRMPNGGFYFDPIVRQPPLDEGRLDPADNMEEFVPLDEAEVAFLGAEAERLYVTTDKALVLVLPGMGFGDVALVPATWLKRPRGIRDFAEWYMSTVIRPDYIRQVFERQCEVALANLQRIYAAVGNRPSVAWVSGTDFGAQGGCLVSPATFRTLYKPFYRAVNDWIHAHTTWKTFTHTCGSIQPLLADIIDAGFDILNPVQTSAANMDPLDLKARWGDRLTFWGGGIDTQHVLPFATPGEVRSQVRERLRIFGPGGGFVFSPVHNVQAGVPVENLIAMYETVAEYGGYPIR